MYSLVKLLAGKTKDPSWLYAMPWIHLLSNQIEPFGTKTVDVTHDSERPVWWGIAEIAEEVEYFKSKSDKWKM